MKNDDEVEVDGKREEEGAKGRKVSGRPEWKDEKEVVG